MERQNLINIGIKTNVDREVEHTLQMFKEGHTELVFSAIGNSIKKLVRVVEYVKSEVPGLFTKHFFEPKETVMDDGSIKYFIQFRVVLRVYAFKNEDKRNLQTYEDSQKAKDFYNQMVNSEINTYASSFSHKRAGRTGVKARIPQKRNDYRIFADSRGPFNTRLRNERNPRFQNRTYQFNYKNDANSKTIKEVDYDQEEVESSNNEEGKNSINKRKYIGNTRGRGFRGRQFRQGSTGGRFRRFNNERSDFNAEKKSRNDEEDEDDDGTTNIILYRGGARGYHRGRGRGFRGGFNNFNRPVRGGFKQFNNNNTNRFDYNSNSNFKNDNQTGIFNSNLSYSNILSDDRPLPDRFYNNNNTNYRNDDNNNKFKFNNNSNFNNFKGQNTQLGNTNNYYDNKRNLNNDSKPNFYNRYNNNDSRQNDTSNYVKSNFRGGYTNTNSYYGNNSYNNSNTSDQPLFGSNYRGNNSNFRGRGRANYRGFGGRGGFNNNDLNENFDKERDNNAYGVRSNFRGSENRGSGFRGRGNLEFTQRERNINDSGY